MIGQITYNGDGSTRIFPVSFEILGEDYVQVFINNIAISDRTKYDIINNSIVFLEGYAPEIGTDNVVILVASSPTEIGDLNTPPSNIQSVLDNISDINTVATNIDNINLVASDLTPINTVSTNITSVNTAALNIIAIQNASSNAAIATTKAAEALTSANNAATSEANTLSYKNSASTSATTAITKASEASTSATTATTKASEASTSATTATTQAGIATTKASEASVSATAAYNAQLAAEAVFDNFDDKYLGAKATAPIVDNDGNPLVTGALFFQTTEPKGIYVYDAELSAWSIFSYIPTYHGTLSGRSNADAHPMSAITGLINAIEGTKGVALASADTTAIGTVGLGNYIHITGTTAITSLGTASSAGVRRTLIFDSGGCVLTHSANIICPGAVSITSVANTVIEVVAETTTIWRVISISHPFISHTELGYLDSLTSNIQIQINAKQATLVSGTNIKTVNGTTLLGSGDLVVGTTIASTAEAQAGTENTKAISSLRLREALNATGSAPIYACRAWVNFNGTGTVAIRGSGNVSGITDNGTGDYTVNFLTAMPDANYATSNSFGSTSGTAVCKIKDGTTPTTSSVNIYTLSSTGYAPIDISQIHLTIFR